jgi:hypothetical protein
LEGLKDLVLFVDRDADAIVDDAQAHEALVDACDRERGVAARPAVLQ